MQITVNGEPRRVASEPDTPLLWVLRDELGLTGTKFGCGIASCGACTVHVDGQAVRSCVLPVGRVAGAVTTIEGLAAAGAVTGGSVVEEGAPEKRAAATGGGADGGDAAGGVGADSSPTLHVVQRAWIEHQVAQCGYCQSGQIMTAAALLAADPRPSDEAIDRSFAGNLCRCGTYPRIRAAVHAAAESLATGRPVASPASPGEATSAAPPVDGGIDGERASDAGTAGDRAAGARFADDREG